MNNKDLLDAVSIVSFLIGIANYNENLSQSDKDDLMAKFDEQTNAILVSLKDEIEEQNKMLQHIIELLEELKNVD